MPKIILKALSQDEFDELRKFIITWLTPDNRKAVVAEFKISYQMLGNYITGYRRNDAIFNRLVEIAENNKTQHDREISRVLKSA
jgi:hypothetical protein